MKKIEINKSSIKKSLLAGALALTMGGLTGCSTNDKKPENNGNENKVVETKPNELTVEETKVLKPGDIIPEGKEVNRELLEKYGMDYVCFYNVYIRKSNGDRIAGSESVLYTYDKRPDEAKINGTIRENGEEIGDVYNVYTLDYIEIVSAEFVYDESNDIYKKQITYGEGQKAFVEVIDENNIDKDKVKTLK